MTGSGLAPEDGIDERDPDFTVKLTRSDGMVLETDARRSGDRDEFIRALDDAVSIELGPRVLPVADGPVVGAAVGSIIPGAGTVLGGIVGQLLAAGAPTVVGSVLIVWIRQRTSDFNLRHSALIGI
jgi:hypothetical protein